jgi:hypothetical protein
MPKGQFERTEEHRRIFRETMLRTQPWKVSHNAVQREKASKQAAILNSRPRTEKQLAHTRSLGSRPATEKRLAAARINVKKAQRAAALVQKQKNGYCEICTKHCNIQKDHSHETGKWRGHLCFSCNSALGLFKDSIETMLEAIAYLRKYN